MTSAGASARSAARSDGALIRHRSFPQGQSFGEPWTFGNVGNQRGTGSAVAPPRPHRAILIDHGARERCGTHDASHSTGRVSDPRDSVQNGSTSLFFRSGTSRAYAARADDGIRCTQTLQRMDMSRTTLHRILGTTVLSL